MSKTNGKLKYDLALSTTSVYDASSIYINKSAELSINGNAHLQYVTVGATYDENNVLAGDIPIPTGAQEKGKTYVYVRHLGPSTAAPLHIAHGTIVGATGEKSPPDGLPKAADEGQIMQLNINEFAFFPLFGPNGLQLKMRVGFIPGSTYWAGATYGQVEFMICQSDAFVGPGNYTTL